MRSSTEAESQSTSSNTVTPISNEENELPESEEAPPPLTQETPKQEEINKQINIENEILVVFYKKKGLNQMTPNDRKKVKTRQANLEKLKKQLKTQPKRIEEVLS